MRVMKDSGVEWIGEIPKEWEVCRFKNVAQLFTGNSIKDDDKMNYEDATEARPYLATKDIDVIFSTANYDNGLYVKRDDITFKVAPVGSTLMCIEGGSAGRKKTKLIQDVSFVNKLCCFQSEIVSESYLYYFVCSPNYEKEFNNNITGLIGGVSVSVLKNIPFLLPPPEQQHRISSYLDNRCAKIDAIIAREQVIIEKLKAYKFSIITEVVTKGLNPKVTMKDSGIEWIGEIPEHWDLTRLSELCSRAITYGIVKLGEEDDTGVKVLRCSDVKPGYIDDSHIRTVKKVLSDEYSRTILEGGEVIINVRGTLGGCAIVPYDYAGYNIAREVAVVPVSTACNRYVMYCLLSTSFSSYQDYSLRGVIYIGLNINLLSRYQMQQPPINEQQDIADYLDIKCSKIDSAIDKKQAVIDKLTEYKKSLIYEVVTGKKEV